MNASPKLLHVSPEQCSLASAVEITGCYYLRLSVDDRPGNWQRLQCLSNHEISLATVSQTPQGKFPASLILQLMKQMNILWPKPLLP